MKKLGALRGEIDGIDNEIAALFNKRMETVKQIADVKKENCAAVTDGAREQEIIDKVTALAKGGNAKYMKKLFLTLFEMSRDYQDEYLGNK